MAATFPSDGPFYGACMQAVYEHSGHGMQKVLDELLGNGIAQVLRQEVVKENGLLKRWKGDYNIAIVRNLMNGELVAVFEGTDSPRNTANYVANRFFCEPSQSLMKKLGKWLDRVVEHVGEPISTFVGHSQGGVHAVNTKPSWDVSRLTYNAPSMVDAPKQLHLHGSGDIISRDSPFAFWHKHQNYTKVPVEEHGLVASHRVAHQRPEEWPISGAQVESQSGPSVSAQLAGTATDCKAAPGGGSEGGAEPKAPSRVPDSITPEQVPEPTSVDERVAPSDTGDKENDAVVVAAGLAAVAGGSFLGYKLVETALEDAEGTQQRKDSTLRATGVAAGASAVGTVVAVSQMGTVTGFSVASGAAGITALGGGSALVGVGACFALPFAATVGLGFAAYKIIDG